LQQHQIRSVDHGYEIDFAFGKATGSEK